MLSQDALLKPRQMENKAAASRCFHLYSLNDTWQVAMFRTPEMLRRVMVAAKSFLKSSCFSLEWESCSSSTTSVHQADHLCGTEISGHSTKGETQLTHRWLFTNLVWRAHQCSWEATSERGTTLHSCSGNKIQIFWEICNSLRQLRGHMPRHCAQVAKISRQLKSQGQNHNNGEGKPQEWRKAGYTKASGS